MPKINYDRRYRDPATLTDYEKRILELRQQGLKWQEIANEIGNKNGASIAVRYKVIEEKLAAARG